MVVAFWRVQLSCLTARLNFLWQVAVDRIQSLKIKEGEEKEEEIANTLQAFRLLLQEPWWLINPDGNQKWSKPPASSLIPHFALPTRRSTTFLPFGPVLREQASRRQLKLRAVAAFGRIRLSLC